jgi:L-threonylcarbamoyladenylate synthase
MRRVTVDPDAPQRDAIEEAAKWILAGGIVAIPTDTLYGLAVDPFRADAVRRLFDVKGRPEDRGLPLIAADVGQVETGMMPLSPLAVRLAACFWPGPLTIVVPAPAALAAGVTAGSGSVAVRVPAHDVARRICRSAGRPVTATSANISGQDATADPDEVERTLGDRIDLLIDTGNTRGGAPSTIVDATTAEPRLIRAGAIRWDEIERCLHRG